MNGNPYETLKDAYERLDPALFLKAIADGANINYDADKLGFGIFHMLEPFVIEPEDSYTPETQSKWFINKKRIIEMLQLAIDKGLTMNELFDEEGSVYYPMVNFLLYAPDDLEFVDWLIEKGFNPVTRYSECSQFEELIYYLKDDIDDCNDHSKWLLKLCKHLMNRFPELQLQYEHEKLISMEEKLDNTKQKSFSYVK